jgi:gliding motility-associated-like protein
VKVFFRITLTTILCGCFHFAFGQVNTTNKGTEFWTAWMIHEDGAGIGGSQMDIYITSDVNTSGTVSVADGSFSQSFTVTANQVTIIPMPASAFIGVEGQFYKGIHVTSLQPIAIYAHIFYSAVSGATLLLPVATLGKDYYSINYTQESNSETDEHLPSYSSFIVIATQDNTTVQITPTQTLTSGKAANTPFTINLKKGELYQGLSLNDLSGTRIQSLSNDSGSCTKIAVFSGSSKIAIGCGSLDATSDNLFQQVYPTAAWGKNYITVPLASRQYDVFRIVFSKPNTNVTLNGQPITTSGFYYEFNSTTPNIISADQPIQVVQYAVSQGKSIDAFGICDNVSGDVGDPEMIYLTPIEQTITHATLYSTHNYDILNEFINVVIPTSAINSFTLDGAAYNNFTTLPGNPVYSYGQLSVSMGTHNIQASTGFNAIAYGFGERESYGYAAGTNLQNLNEYIVLNNPQTDSTQVNGCTGVNYKLQIVLPYQTNSIEWDFKDGTKPYTDNNPTVVSTITKGTQTLYVYQYPMPAKTFTAGNYKLVATVFDPVADACGSNETVELDFNIADPPVAQFTTGGVCAGDTTSFTDQSNANGSIIQSWLWNFGDGQTSVIQNPKHLFTSPGNYRVTLITVNQNGCASVPYTQTVNIAAKPLALFNISAPACAGEPITLTDNSTAANGTINKWIWTFGDGAAPDTLSTNAPFTHTYTDTGAYNVTLTVILSTGCVSNVYSQSIHIAPLPVVNFSLPAVCLSDAYAQFTDESTISGNSQAGFSWLWNFGDPNATPANPNTSTEQNPKHKYSQVRDSTNPYLVTLTVTSASGCSASKTQNITVNGDTPVAAFTVENSSNSCSGNAVTFDDNSSVNFGVVTKLVWYFDYGNNPADSIAYLGDSIPANHKFTHNYGYFNSPPAKSFTVRMDAYSGQTCVNTATQTISILANPLVTLTAADSVCQNAQPFQIVENKNGFSGTGVFSGSGVSSTGLFNPAIAGIGQVAINYLFTAQNGCTYDTTLQIKVNPAPAVTLESSVTLLQGGSVTLKPGATGSNLTYKWTPAAGLDHDNVPDPAASPSDDTEYTLTVTSDQGCSATASVLVHVLQNPVVPNAFTPNGDGVNDNWDIQYLNTYPGNTVDVFNRYGQKVFTSVGYGVPWDGKCNGADVPAGVYYYIINPKNGRKLISGYVTVIR